MPGEGLAHGVIQRRTPTVCDCCISVCGGSNAHVAMIAAFREGGWQVAAEFKRKPHRINNNIYLLIHMLYIS